MIKRLLMISTLALSCACVTHAATCNSLNGGTVSTGGITSGGTTYATCTIDAGAITLGDFQLQGFGSVTAFFAAGASGFDVSWNPNEPPSSDWQFEYAVVSSTIDINEVSLSSGGNADSSVLENVCTTHMAIGSGACTGTLLAQMTQIGTGSQSALITPSNSLWAWKDISTGANGLNSGFSQDFSVVPEPGALMLLGSGLIGLAGFLRKKGSTVK